MGHVTVEQWLAPLPHRKKLAKWPVGVKVSVHSLYVIYSHEEHRCIRKKKLREHLDAKSLVKDTENQISKALLCVALNLNAG